jgi:branched-chain amino acid transport system substrate-binding protein
VDEANRAGGVNGHRIESRSSTTRRPEEGGNADRAGRRGRLFGDLRQRAQWQRAGHGAGHGSAPHTRDHLGPGPEPRRLKDPYLFLNSTTSTTFDETLAAYVVDKLKLTSIALISNDGAYGKGERAAFTAALASRGLAPAADQVVSAGRRTSPRRYRSSDSVRRGPCSSAPRSSRVD